MLLVGVVHVAVLFDVALGLHVPMPEDFKPPTLSGVLVAETSQQITLPVPAPKPPPIPAPVAQRNTGQAGATGTDGCSRCPGNRGGACADCCSANQRGGRTGCGPAGGAATGRREPPAQPTQWARADATNRAWFT